MDKISVIMPVYNCEGYLRKSIESVLNQTYENLELILINDGSTDGSLEICEGYKKKDSRIILINKKNSGVSASRNAGIKKATGRYITFIDADDWVEDIMYETMINQFNTNEIQFVLCGCVKETQDGNKIELINNSEALINQNTFSVDYFIRRIYVDSDIMFNVWNSIFIRKQVAEVLFDERTSIAEDNLYILENLLKCHRGAICNQKFYHYVQHEDSVSNKKVVTEKNITKLIAEQEQLRILKVKYKKIYSYCKFMLIRDAVNLSKKIIINNQYNKRWEKHIRKIIVTEIAKGSLWNKNIPKGINKNAIIIALSFKKYRKMYSKYKNIGGAR